MLKFGKMAQKSGGVATPASQTTIGIYLRQLRTIYNDAIGKGIVNRDLYPFTQKGYVIPSGRNEKKALIKEEIKKIMTYEALGAIEQVIKTYNNYRPHASLNYKTPKQAHQMSDNQILRWYPYKKTRFSNVIRKPVNTF